MPRAPQGGDSSGSKAAKRRAPVGATAGSSSLGTLIRALLPLLIILAAIYYQVLSYYLPGTRCTKNTCFSPSTTIYSTRCCRLNKGLKPLTGTKLFWGATGWDSLWG